VNLWWSGLIGVRMPATVPLRYRGPREVNPLRGSAKDQGVGLPCPDRDSHPSEVGRRAGPETLSGKPLSVPVHQLVVGRHHQNLFRIARFLGRQPSIGQDRGGLSHR
jgi:hypothetical protein